MDINTLYQKYTSAASDHIEYPVDFQDFINSINHICDYPDECESWLVDLFTTEEFDYILDTLTEE